MLHGVKTIAALITAIKLQWWELRLWAAGLAVNGLGIGNGRLDSTLVLYSL
jgi:hypothetical protein